MTGDPLVVCAVRYALGRETYTVADVVMAVHTATIDEATARMVARDIDRALRECRAGGPVDADHWRRLLDHLMHRHPKAALEVEADRAQQGGAP